MSSVHPPAKVLVTGATGFIGSWTARMFLERGYDVRGTVRTKDKGEWLARQQWAQATPGKFEYVIVEDMSKAGAFDEAVKDVAVVAHVASPASFTPGLDPSELIGLAVGGTLGVLNSALHHGAAVRRVVITSSIGAVPEPTQTTRVFTEKDWSTFSLKEVEANGVDTTPTIKYTASKMMAEKAAWEFMEQHKGKLQFEVTTVLPGFTYGPIIHEVTSFDKLNASIMVFYEHVHNEVPLHTTTGLGSYVDVRDVAAMHVDVVESDQAPGQRFLANAGQHTWQGIYDVLNAHPHPIPGIPVGIPGAGKTVFLPMHFSNEKAKALLGTRFRSLEEMSYDTVMSLQERGFW